MINQFSDITKPVIIMPFHFNSALLYHAITKAGANVLGFWDNNKTIIGESYDGKSITPPVPAEQLAQDVTIIIYYKKCEDEIKSQLESLGYSDFISAQSFDKEALLRYCADICNVDLFRIRPDYKSVHRRELRIDSSTHLPMTDDEARKESLQKLFASRRGARKILMVAESLSLTGAPIALLQAARVLLENGDLPVLLCKNCGDALLDMLEVDGIPIIIDFTMPENDYFGTLASYFDMVIVNTVIPACVTAIEKLNGSETPVLWWIHEAEMYYTESVLSAMPDRFNDNINIFCAGEYARRVFESYVPHTSSAILPLGMTDFYKAVPGYEPESDSGKISFMTIGTIEARKGQDIFCSAIRMMDEKLRAKSEFIFVGHPSIDNTVYNDVMALKRDYPQSVMLTGVVQRNEIAGLLHRCGCMVCASRSEPTGMFIVEAMMFRKICICSKNAGISDYIDDGVDGFVYTKNSAEQLCEKLEYVARHFDKLDDMREKSRAIYDDYFNITVFRRNLLSVINEIIG